MTGKKLYLISGSYTYSNLPNIGTLDLEAYLLAFMAKNTCCTKELFADSATITDLTVTGTLTANIEGDFESLALEDGLVSALALSFGADENNGFYGVSDTVLGVAIEGSLVSQFGTTGIASNVVSELTAASGVTVDGALIKDGGISANSMFAGFFPTTAAQALSGAGAVNVTAYLTKYTSTGGAQALTIASGTQIGQRKRVSHVADGGSGVLTGVFVGGTTITFTTVAEYADLMWTGSAWAVLELGNSAVPGTPPALA